MDAVDEAHHPCDGFSRILQFVIALLDKSSPDGLMMKKAIAVFGVIALFSLAYAAEQGRWPAPYQAFKGEYTIYSGDLDDQQAPIKDDRKLSFIIEGAAAKEIFNAMPPDDKQICSTEKGARSRTKDKVWCSFKPSDGYACYFGFDLRSGKSIAGGTC